MLLNNNRIEESYNIRIYFLNNATSPLWYKTYDNDFAWLTLMYFLFILPMNQLGLRNLSNLAVLCRNNSLITGINFLTINVAVVTYMLSNSTRRSLPEMEKLLKTQVEHILLATYGKVGVFFAYNE